MRGLAKAAAPAPSLFAELKALVALAGGGGWSWAVCRFGERWLQRAIVGVLVRRAGSVQRWR